LISLYSLLALPGGILLDARRALPLAWLTLALSAVGFLFAQVLVWGDPGWEPVGQVTLTLLAFLVACTQTSATASRLRPGDTRAVRALFALSIVLVLVLATMVTVAVWREVDSEGFARALAALAVANVLLVALQPVLRRLAGTEGTPSYRLRLTLAGGAEQEVELQARDFADAVARAVRESERSGSTVERIDRIARP
jgi:hypothetical protein